MIGIFNFHNFIVSRDSSSPALSKEANISCSKLPYGKKIQESGRPAEIYMDAIYSSFGEPSYTVENAYDGPVECWIISSPHKREIIYIEYWKNAFPKRMYIFFNTIDNITSSFIKSLYEIVQ